MATLYMFIKSFTVNKAFRRLFVTKIRRRSRRRSLLNMVLLGYTYHLSRLQSFFYLMKIL